MRTKNLCLSALTVVAIGACGGGSGDFDAFLKLDTEKAAAFNAGGSDCTAKAKSVGEWRTKNTANYKVMREKLNAKFPAGPPKDYLEKHGDVMKANKKAVLGAMMACTNDPAFSKMMEETKTP